MHLSLVGSTKQMSDLQKSKKCSDRSETMHTLIFYLEEAQCPMSRRQLSWSWLESDFLSLEPAYLSRSSQLALNPSPKKLLKPPLTSRPLPSLPRVTGRCLVTS